MPCDLLPTAGVCGCIASVPGVRTLHGTGKGIYQSESMAWQALEEGLTLDEVHEFTNIDPWFLAQLGELHQAETWLKTQKLTDLRPEDLLQVKKRGFSDIQIARSTGVAAALCLHIVSCLSPTVPAGNQKLLEATPGTLRPETRPQKPMLAGSQPRISQI